VENEGFGDEGEDAHLGGADGTEEGEHLVETRESCAQGMREAVWVERSGAGAVSGPAGIGLAGAGTWERPSATRAERSRAWGAKRP
jgi:hypothetical protein